jgi:hypothetical protein
MLASTRTHESKRRARCAPSHTHNSYSYLLTFQECGDLAWVPFTDEFQATGHRSDDELHSNVNAFLNPNHSSYTKTKRRKGASPIHSQWSFVETAVALCFMVLIAAVIGRALGVHHSRLIRRCPRHRGHKALTV